MFAYICSVVCLHACMLYACMLICLHALLYACVFCCVLVCLYAWLCFFVCTCGCMLLCSAVCVFCCMLGMLVCSVVCLVCLCARHFLSHNWRRAAADIHLPPARLLRYKSEICVTAIALARSLDSSVAILPQFCSCFGNESLL